MPAIQLKPADRGALFDKDGTLADQESVALKVWMTAADRLGLPLTMDTMRGFLGRDKAYIDAALEAHWGPIVVPDSLAARLVAAEREKLGMTGPVNPLAAAELVRAIRDGEMKILRENNQIPVLPGFDRLTGYLRHLAGNPEPVRVGTGIVSMDPQENVRLFADRAGVADLFEIMIGREQMTRPKPHPDGFLLAAQLLNVEPSKCAVVGDTTMDKDAAEAARMRFIAVPNKHFLDASWARGSYRICQTLDEVPLALHEALGLPGEVPAFARPS